MKIIIPFLTLLIFATTVNADNNLLGTWKDKSESSSHKYEFKKDHDFLYTYTWNNKGKMQSHVVKGVWETGSWTVTSSRGTETECTLTIYAGTAQCCFEYKFIADNLIITKRYETNSYAGMCDNRVLIKESKKKSGK